MEGQDDDRGADADALGARRDPAGDDHEVRGDAIPLEVMLGEPDAVEAERLGLLDLLELGAEDVFVTPAGGLLEEVEGAEFHRCAIGCWLLAIGGLHLRRQYSDAKVIATQQG